MSRLEERLRPVRLHRVVLGYDCNESWSDFRFEISLNYKLPSVIATYSNNKPTLIFVSTRKSAQTTASALIQHARFVRDAQHKQLLLTVANSLRDSRLRECVMCGVGYHHAGIEVQDRRYIEELFITGELLVLVATSTLAVGVNLPAHLVIIKSTAQYVGGSYQEYSCAQLLQMTGRAGRPQFDSEATAVIMTKKQHKTKYENLVNGKDVLESYLHFNLVEHLNAEIVLGTVTDLAVAVEWLRSTFFYVRVQHNPRHYGLPLNMKPSQLEAKLQELCTREVNGLSRAGLIVLDEMDVKPTTPGKLMARYCVTFTSMKTFLELRGDESLKELVEILSACREFRDIKVRMSEKRVLNELNKSSNSSVRFPIIGKIKTREQKINCLIQAVFGSLNIVDPGLNQDSAKIMRTGQRITKCLTEYGATRSDYELQLNTVLLAKSFACKLWENSRHVTRQLDRIGQTLSAALVQAKITSFTALEETTPRNIELILNRQPPFGNRIREQAVKLPRYELMLEQLNEVRATESDLKVTIRLANHAELREGATTPKHHSSRLIIGDMDNHVVFQQRITDNALMVAGSVTRELTVTRASSGDELAVNFISETWAGLDVQSSYTPRYLTKPPASTPMSLSSSASSVGALPSATPFSNAERFSGGTGTTKRTTLEEGRRACLHTCNNKRTCAHICCKSGVTVQASCGPGTRSTSGNSKGNVPVYVQGIRQKASQMQGPAPKKLRMTSSSGNVLSKFQFTPRGPMLMPKPAPRVAEKQFYSGTSQTCVYKENSSAHKQPVVEGLSHMPVNPGGNVEESVDSFPDMEVFNDLEDGDNYEDAFNDSLEMSEIPDIQDKDGPHSFISSSLSQKSSISQSSGVGVPSANTVNSNFFTKASTLGTTSKPYRQQQQRKQQRLQEQNQQKSKMKSYNGNQTRQGGQLSLDRWLQNSQNIKVGSQISPAKAQGAGEARTPLFCHVHSLTRGQNSLNTNANIATNQGVTQFMTGNKEMPVSSAQTYGIRTKKTITFEVPCQQQTSVSNSQTLQIPKVFKQGNIGFQASCPRFGIPATQDTFLSQNNCNIPLSNPNLKGTTESASTSGEHLEKASKPLSSSPKFGFTQMEMARNATITGASITQTTFVVPPSTNSVCNPSNLNSHKSQNVIDNLRKTQDLIDMLKTQTENLEALQKSIHLEYGGSSAETRSQNSSAIVLPDQNTKCSLDGVNQFMKKSSDNKWENLQFSNREGKNTSQYSQQRSLNASNEPVSSEGQRQKSYGGFIANFDRGNQVTSGEQKLNYLPAKLGLHHDKPVMGVKPMITKDSHMPRSQARGAKDVFPQLTKQFKSSEQLRDQCKPSGSAPKYPAMLNASFSANNLSTPVKEKLKAEWRDLEMFQWCRQQEKRSLSNLYNEAVTTNLPATREIKQEMGCDFNNQKPDLDSLSQDLFADSPQEPLDKESSAQLYESELTARQEAFAYRQGSLYGRGEPSSLSLEPDPYSQPTGPSLSFHHAREKFLSKQMQNSHPEKPVSFDTLSGSQLPRPLAEKREFKSPFKYMGATLPSQHQHVSSQLSSHLPPSNASHLSSLGISSLQSLHSGSSSQAGTQNPGGLMSGTPRFQLTYGDTQTGVGVTSVGGFQQNININLSNILPSVTPAHSNATSALSDATPRIEPLRGILKKTANTAETNSHDAWENRSDIFDGLI
ncbi:probable ATP-dependent DNA helicase HFM1 [Macrobrachium nipponense]|uniref:probable ATP-dependent DNA helicase HFM1 n=1 Tax=Macrobrachium nipponense TaxID=159736 RepID=UPI0030C8B79D